MISKGVNADYFFHRVFANYCRSFIGNLVSSLWWLKNFRSHLRFEEVTANEFISLVSSFLLEQCILTL